MWEKRYGEKHGWYIVLKEFEEEKERYIVGNSCDIVKDATSEDIADICLHYLNSGYCMEELQNLYDWAKTLKKII